MFNIEHHLNAFPAISISYINLILSTHRIVYFLVVFLKFQQLHEKHVKHSNSLKATTIQIMNKINGVAHKKHGNNVDNCDKKPQSTNLISSCFER